jgi:hypothetical protein
VRIRGPPRLSLIKAKIRLAVMLGGLVMTDPNAPTDRGHPAIEANPLEFECRLFQADTCAAADKAGLAFLLEDLEDATKIIAGLGMLCKLGRNHQDLASGASEEESSPLSPITMESLFHLGEVAARRFLSALRSCVV